MFIETDYLNDYILGPIFIETDYLNDYILGPVHVVSLQMALHSAQFPIKLL